MKHLDLDAVLADRETQIVLVCGSGGVGKTTIAAALALRAAEAGARVAVMTIDPARRLATALGVDALTNEPQPVAGIDPRSDGSLDAMMLDMKRTFDDAIRAHATPQRAAALLNNPFYIALSTSFSGTQEYMAMEKLGELYREGVEGDGRWDLIVVDTPPAASALDFLDAPERLRSLLDGRMLKALLSPARGGLRFLGGGVTLLAPVLSAIVGPQALRDLETFVLAFDSVLGGFDERAQRTRRTLSSAHTACVVVATPEPGPLREALGLVERLRHDAIRCVGAVINRLPEAPPPLTSSSGDGRSDPDENNTDENHTVRWLRRYAAEQIDAADVARERLRVLPEDLAIVTVPSLPGEVIANDQLRRLGEQVAAG